MQIRNHDWFALNVIAAFGEFVRRHTPAVEALTSGTASVLLAAALPGIPAAIGAIVPFGGGPADRPARTSATVARTATAARPGPTVGAFRSGVATYRRSNDCFGV